MILRELVTELMRTPGINERYLHTKQNMFSVKRTTKLILSDMITNTFPVLRDIFRIISETVRL